MHSRNQWEIYLNNAKGPWAAAMDRMQFNCRRMSRDMRRLAFVDREEGQRAMAREKRGSSLWRDSALA